MTVSSFLRLKSFDPVNAVTSYFYGPKVLLITRLFGSIYILAVLIGALATTPSFRYFISFFTHISFCALFIYYLWSLVWSIQYCRLSEQEKMGWSQRVPRVLGYIYWIVYSSLVVYHLFIPILYWSILRRHQKPHTGVYEWATISEHSIDGVLVIVELVLTRMRIEIRHLLFALGFMLLYLLTTFVGWWTSGWFVYSFLDFETQGWPKTIMYYGIVTASVIIVYVIAWKLHDLKAWLAERREAKGAQARTAAGILPTSMSSMTIAERVSSEKVAV